MDYLRRLQNTDGSLISLVSGAGGTPPSSATDKSLYGKVSTSATMTGAAAFALGAKIYDMIGLTCYADTLQIAAEKAWIWAKNNPSVNWDNTTDNAWKTAVGWSGGGLSCGDYDRKMYALEAATYLYDITGTAEYKTFFDANYAQCNLIGWNHVYPFEHNYQETLLHYTTVNGATPAVVTAIKNSYNTGMNKSFASNGVVFGPYDSKADAYNSYMKDYVWGSNSNKCGTGLLYIENVKYNINPSRNTDAMTAAENYIHYIHGLNALSKNYLSNMNPYGADNSVTEFYHSWFKDGSALWDKVGVSTYGPAPGFLVGGPNPNYTGADNCCKTTCGSPENTAKCTAIDVSKIMGQPKQKSYTDFNTDWQLKSWEITENSCGYQVNYIRLLSNFVKNLGSSPVLDDCITTSSSEVATVPVEVFPNPSEHVFNVLCPENFTAEIYSIDGKLMEKIQGRGNVEFGKNLAAGTYTVKVYQSNDSKNFKVVKM
jgi:hypothetical protein